MTTFAGSSQAGADDGVGSHAQFRTPNGLDIDSTGALFVADAGNDRIRRISIDGTVSTVTGSTKGFIDGQVGVAKFNSPYGVAVSESGDIYVADTGNNCIRVISGSRVTTIAGTATAGNSDGIGPQASFNQPFSIAFDHTGELIVADAGNHRLRRVTIAGVVSTIAGSTAGLVDGRIVDAKFSVVSDAAIDNSGTIYVADLTNNCIRKVNSGLTSVYTLAGDHHQGDADGPGGVAEFNFPTGLCFDYRVGLLVADNRNHKIKTVSNTDGFVRTLAGAGQGYQDGPIDTAKFNSPTDIVIGRDGTIFIADTNNNCIRAINP